MANKKSKGFPKIIGFIAAVLVVVGALVFAVVPKFTEPSWGKIGQMMAKTDPAEDSGRLVLSEKDKERIRSANYPGSAELTDVSGTGASGTIHAGFENGTYSFYGEFQGLPAVSPGQSYQVWLVRDKPFEYIPAATIIVTDSASYQVEPISGADLIDWQEVAAFAVADPARYQRWLMGESQDLAERWRFAAETGPDGLGKTRATTYYGSSTDLAGYDRVVMTLEEPDGNPRPGKFILQGKVATPKSAKTSSKFPAVYSVSALGGSSVSFLGSQDCPEFEISETGNSESILIFCGGTKEQAQQARENWKAGRLKVPITEIKTPSSNSQDGIQGYDCYYQCVDDYTSGKIVNSLDVDDCVNRCEIGESFSETETSTTPDTNSNGVPSDYVVPR